jgi:hypothetical protein
MTRKRRISGLPRQTAASLAAGFLLFTLACDRPKSSEGAEAAPAVFEAPAAPTAGAPHGGGGEKALAAEGATVTTPSFRFELPATWRREQPSSGMRLAQAVVPGEAGPGELAVFHFGAGQGGGVEANFERWLGQIEPAAGSAPERGDFAVDGFEVSWIDARGTLLPSTMGSGPSSPQPGFRLLGGVVEGEGGPWFFKVTGPDSTLQNERQAFFALLRGVGRP